MKKNYIVTFRKLEQDEKIPVGVFHSLDDGETLSPIQRVETINQTPNDFGNDRSFWVMESLKSPQIRIL